MSDLQDLERQLPGQLQELASTVGLGGMTRSAIDRRVHRMRRRRLQSAVGATAAACVALVVVLALRTDSRPSSEVRSAAAPASTATANRPVLPQPSESPTTTTAPDGLTSTPITTSPDLSSQPALAPGPPQTASGDAVLAEPSQPSAADTVSNSPPPTAAPPPSTAPASQGPVTITVTEADGSTSYSLHPGDHLVVRLASGTSADFSEPESSNEAVLRKTGGSASPDGGAQASFVAVTDGQATVRYAADPKCGKSTPPCLAPSTVVPIYVTVSG